MAIGRKTGGGSRKGSPNKSTKDVKALALKYVPSAIQRLAHLAVKAQSEQAQVAACKELLDRAVGKASQPIGQADDLQPIFQRVFFGDKPAA